MGIVWRKIRLEILRKILVSYLLTLMLSYLDKKQHDFNSLFNLLKISEKRRNESSLWTKTVLHQLLTVWLPMLNPTSFSLNSIFLKLVQCQPRLNHKIQPFVVEEVHFTHTHTIRKSSKMDGAKYIPNFAFKWW